MSDYIKREDAYTAIHAQYPQLLDAGVQLVINAIPAADVVERKSGEWVTDVGLYLTEEPLDFVRCSLCGKVHPKWGYNFCPNCGADMRERNEDGPIV